MAIRARGAPTDGGFDATLRAARDGDDAAWARLYRTLAGPLLGYLTSQGVEDPENLVGEVMLQVVRDLHRFHGDESGFRSWVFTIAHRRVIDARRAAGRRRHSAATHEELDAAMPPATAEPEVLERLGTNEVLGLLGHLTEDQREVLVLRLVAGLRAGEIASVTGRSTDAVKALQKRGIARLRPVLAATPTAERVQDIEEVLQPAGTSSPIGDRQR